MTQTAWQKDRLFGAGMGIVSATLAFQSFRYPAESAQFPRFLSLLLLLLSALLLVRVARTPRPEGPSTAQALRPPLAIAGLVRSPTIFVFVVSAAYVLAMQWLGFLSGSVCFMVGCAWLLGHRRWAAGLAWGVLFPVGLYLLFHSMLGLALPTGWLK